MSTQAGEGKITSLACAATRADTCQLRAQQLSALLHPDARQPVRAQVAGGRCAQALAAARPRWIDHMLLNEIFDGDMAYLAKASQYAKARRWPCSPRQARGAALQRRRRQLASRVRRRGRKRCRARAQATQQSAHRSPAVTVGR